MKRANEGTIQAWLRQYFKCSTFHSSYYFFFGSWRVHKIEHFLCPFILFRLLSFFYLNDNSVNIDFTSIAIKMENFVHFLCVFFSLASLKNKSPTFWWQNYTLVCLAIGSLCHIVWVIWWRRKDVRFDLNNKLYFSGASSAFQTCEPISFIFFFLDLVVQISIEN